MIDDTDSHEVLLAIPSVSRSRRREILASLEAFSVHVRTIPGFMDLASGRVKVDDLQEVAIADLLGRDVVPPNRALLERCIQDRVVMVTGAGGSIGAELCRQIVAARPATLLLFEHSEFNLYSIHNELEQRLRRESLAVRLRVALSRLAGTRAGYLLEITQGTVNGVIYGILGTALAQGVLAAIGFLIAGVPAAMLLGVVTFFFSVVPVGPPLVWGGAAIWLFQQGELGWAVFVAAWGFFLVSMVDNVIKPFIISRGSRLPFAVVLLGVLGGVLAFGVIGVFLGPTLLDRVTPDVSDGGIADSRAEYGDSKNWASQVAPRRDETPALPMAAPKAIIPSSPRFNTPARSTTNSPSAASRNGVAADSIPARMNSIPLMTALLLCGQAGSEQR